MHQYSTHGGTILNIGNHHFTHTRGYFSLYPFLTYTSRAILLYIYFFDAILRPLLNTSMCCLNVIDLCLTDFLLDMDNQSNDSSDNGIFAADVKQENGQGRVNRNLKQI